jgi:hypothetical protein
MRKWIVNEEDVLRRMDILKMREWFRKRYSCAFVTYIQGSINKAINNFEEWLDALEGSDE